MNENEIKQIGTQETEISNLIRLPLWKTCVDTMLKTGIEFGSVYKAEFFEEQLRCKRTDMKFSLAISQIRRRLESEGFYLSGQGLKGDSFVILEPNQNRDVMSSYSSKALDALKRGVILGTNTRMDLLSAEDRRRHESVLEKIAMRLMLCKKPKTFTDALKEANKLVQDSKEEAA